MSNTRHKPMVEWNTINWQKLERRVFKLQKRIFQASNRGDIKAVRKLQKTLMRSWSAKALAVRKVSQDNQGKKTAGVDGIKSLTPSARLRLVKTMRLGTKSLATRRVWIPKPGTDAKRPLGIPTMNDRALQALVKLALEPEWEAVFEPNSYGFRQGRSCHDAVEAIFITIKQKSKFVLDADLSKCFDKINHSALLKKLNTFPTLRRQIQAWLKAGVMDGQELLPTAEGTPQGGVISPLLANIALHGMEQVIKKYAESIPGTKRDNRSAFTLIRYADDFVILHENAQHLNVCRDLITEWLKDMGLELNPQKTKIRHTFVSMNDEIGFDFLGFNVRQYPVGKNHSAKNSNGKVLGFKTLIKPSNKKIKEHYQELCKIIDEHKSAPQKALISKLNPIIRGWANYYSTVVSKEIFESLDHQLFQKLQVWANSRHPKKSKSWINNKYWHTVGGNNWVFSTKYGTEVVHKLLRHQQTQIVRHVKVKGTASPFDGNLVYWSARQGKNPQMPYRVTKLLKQQKGKCALCNLYFREEDVLEVDHILPKSKGGKDEYKNFQLLHRHCHDTKTARDGVRYA